MESFVQDCRHAVRSLTRNVSFTVGTVITLGLGVGVVTGFFAVVDAVLLTPLAPHGDTVVRVWKLDAERSIERFPISYPELKLWKDGARSFHSLAAIRYAETATVAVLAGRDAVPVTLAPVSADFFAVLHGGAPLLGRWFTAADEGNAVELTAVASERFWQRVGGGDPSFVGRRFHWPGGSRAIVVIGVAPSSLTFPEGTDLWVPIDGYCTTDANTNLDIRSRGFANFHFVGRLRPGVSVASARAELDAVSRAVVAQFPKDLQPRSIVVEPLLAASLGALAPLTMFLFGAALLVFLAAGGNVAALLVMRASAQTRDAAVRVALGASRLRLARQALAESAVLGAAGALLGVPLAQLCVVLARSVGGSQIPRLESATLNVSVLAFCAAAAFAWVITLGTIPLWYRRRVEAGHVTQHLANRSTRPSLTLRTMIVAQVTAAVIVTTAAGLLVRSFVHLRAIDRGFDVSRLAAVSLMIPEAQYASPAAREAFYARLLPTLTALPGVVNATTLHLGPGTGQTGLSAPMLFEGQDPGEAPRNPYGTWEPIMPTYFDTLGIPITQGRGFTDADDSNAPRVAIVSESVARRYWPGQNPIGRRLQFTPQFPWTTVVGVAADSRYRELTRDWLTVYFPAKQFFFFSPSVIVVRTASEPAMLLSSLRQAIQAAAPEAAVHSVGTIEQLASAEIARQRTAVIIATAFAFMAIFVAAVGVYAVSSYEVTNRTRDLAVRAAIGASPAQILGGALRQSVVLGVGGAVIGLLVASLVTRFLAALLFEVMPLDAASFVAAGAGLLAIVVLASVVPARRAARVDPALLLRSE